MVGSTQEHIYSCASLQRGSGSRLMLLHIEGSLSGGGELLC